MYNQEFVKINFRENPFSEKEIEACHFNQCDFTEADLSHLDFIDCHFFECNFSLAKLNNTGIKDCAFVKTKLSGLDFGLCNDFLFAIRVEECQIDYCSFFKKKLKKTRFEDCSLKETDFTEADLSEAAFINCNLDMAVFFRTNLEKTDFLSSYNYNFNPDENQIRKAKFSLRGLPGLLAKHDIVVEE